MPTRPDYVMDVADVLLSTCNGGEVRCNIGDASDGTGFGAEVMLMCGEGFYGMPNDATPAGACMLMYTRDGQQKTAFASWDGRFHEKAGAPKQGDRWIISNCDARILLRREQNQLTLYTTNTTDDDSTMLFDQNGSVGESQWVNGASFIKMLKDRIVLCAGGCVIEMKAGTVSIFAKHIALNSGGGNLGTLGPAPPIAPAFSLLFGTMGMAGLPSTKWTIGGQFVSACKFGLPQLPDFPPGLPALPTLALPLPLSLSIDLGFSIKLPTIELPDFPPGLPALPTLALPLPLSLNIDLGFSIKLPTIEIPDFPPGLPALPTLALPELPSFSCPLD